MARIGIGFPNQGAPPSSFNMPPSVFPVPPSARPNTPASGRKLQQAGLLQTLSQVLLAAHATGEAIECTLRHLTDA